MIDHHKIGRSSKNKGKRGEAECVRLFRDNGYEVHRTVQYNGRSPAGAADLDGIPGLHIEVKRVERLNIQEAVDQTTRDHKPGTLRAVFHRKNNCEWLVTMPAEDWFRIFREYYNGEKI